MIFTTRFLSQFSSRAFFRHKSTNKEAGDALESRVARILAMEGRWNIRRNVHVRDRFGNRSEIDVMHGIFFQRCIECKNYAHDHSVPLEAVAKFKEVLQLNGYSLRRSLFVTTSTFVPRALTIDVPTMDGKALAAWESRARRRQRLRRAVGAALVVLSLSALPVLLLAGVEREERRRQAAREPPLLTAGSGGTLISGLLEASLELVERVEVWRKDIGDFLSRLGSSSGSGGRKTG